MTEDEKLRGLLRQIDDEHHAWIDFFSKQRPEDLTTKLGNQNWSAADTLVQITSWQANALKVAREIASGQITEFNPNSTPAGVLHINVDKFNEEIFISHKNWSVDRVLRWNEQVFNDLRGAVVKLPMKKIFGGSSCHITVLQAVGIFISS